MDATELAGDIRQSVRAAIKAVRSQIRWKPGKGQAHLRTRQEYGHLPSSATLPDYEALIRTIVWDDNAKVYLYRWETGTIYPAILGEYGGQMWLVICTLEGVLETAFPPTDVEGYLSNPRFQFLGLMWEIFQ